MWWNVPAQTFAALRADQGFEPADHLAGRPPGEGDQQDRLGRDPPGDQVGDPVGDDPRLARARPGQDQVEAVGGGRRRVLRLVQVGGELRGQPVVARFLEPDLSHAACSPVARIVSLRLRESEIVL